MSIRRLLPLPVTVSVALIGCQERPTAPNAPAPELATSAPTPTDVVLQDIMTLANEALERQDIGLMVYQAEWIAAPGSEEVGRTVEFRDVGNKQIPIDWVPGDPRRFGPGNGLDVTYLVDQSAGATSNGLSSATTEAAIDRAMATWDLATQCSNVPTTKVADDGADHTLIDGFLGVGPFGIPAADIVHAGWQHALKPTLAPTTILGVTFTLVFSPPGDINHDGKIDAAIREIYYNDAFPWGMNSGFPIDVETVALHEAGHGLSQAHFGTLFQIDATGRFQFAPRALMNAGYTGVQQGASFTDLAGHCSIWGNWPNN